MAVAVSNVIANGSAATASSYATASVSLVAGRLYLLTVRHVRSTAALATTPTVSGASQTWTQVASWSNSDNNRRRTTIFRCLPASNQSGVLTIDFASETQNACDWVLDEFTGIDTGGTNGSVAVVQAVGNDSGASSVTSFSITLSAFGSTNNATYGVFVSGLVAVTQEGGYTETSDRDGTGSGHVQTQFLASSDTTPSWTLGSTVVYSAHGLEIKAAATGFAYSFGAIIGG